MCAIESNRMCNTKKVKSSNLEQKKKINTKYKNVQNRNLKYTYKIGQTNKCRDKLEMAKKNEISTRSYEII